MRLKTSKSLFEWLRPSFCIWICVFSLCVRACAWIKGIRSKRTPFGIRCMRMSARAYIYRWYKHIYDISYYENERARDIKDLWDVYEYVCLCLCMIKQRAQWMKQCMRIYMYNVNLLLVLNFIYEWDKFGSNLIGFVRNHNETYVCCFAHIFRFVFQLIIFLSLCLLMCVCSAIVWILRGLL